MDATLSYGLPRVNQSGTLLEGIALWGELKPLLTEEASSNALGLLRLGGGQGACSLSAATWTPAMQPAARARCYVEVSAAWRPTLICNSSPSRRTACCARRAAWRA